LEGFHTSIFWTGEKRILVCVAAVVGGGCVLVFGFVFGDMTFP
jgi:hypothetical protein